MVGRFSSAQTAERVIPSASKMTKTRNTRLALFVGVEEEGAPTFQYRATPKGSVVLPKEMVEAEAQLMDAWNKSVQTGNGTKEDYSQGHALAENPQVRAGQEKQERERTIRHSKGHARERR